MAWSAYVWILVRERPMATISHAKNDYVSHNSNDVLLGGVHSEQSENIYRVLNQLRMF